MYTDEHGQQQEEYFNSIREAQQREFEITMLKKILLDNENDNEV
jgi:hypothetical protein